MTSPGNRVLVVGSLHYDIMLDAPHLPARGETVTGHRWYPKFGGKGGNQAVAAARHGCETCMLGAVGGDYDRRRFRLDDSGVAPRGVGEETGFSFTGRLSFNPRSDLSVNLLAGVFFGEYELEASSGATVSDIDLDPAAFLGVTARFRF